MTGLEFQRYFCEWARGRGWWALDIPRSKTGQQPFDIIAIRGSSAMAVDCKVISSSSKIFPLARVEDDQWLSFWSVRKRSEQALVGVVVWHNMTRTMYYIRYEELVEAVKAKKKSIVLDESKEISRIELLLRIK